MLIFTFALTAINLAQKPVDHSQLQILPDETEQSKTFNNMRINSKTEVPIALYKVNYNVNPDTPERMARQYLIENSELLKLKSNLSDLRYLITKETLAAYHVHFAQYIGEYPVYNSTLNITIDRTNNVVFVMNGYKLSYGVKVEPDLENIMVTANAALLEAKNYLGILGTTAHENSETVIYYNKGIFRLAQKVNIVPSEEIFGDWEVLVDAQTGEILRVQDKACYLHSGGDDPNLVNGSGWVFDPDPITHARTTYGSPGFVDNNDADSDSLTAHIEQRTLNDIDFNGSVYTLKGPWAEIQDFESPFTGLHTNPTSDFHVTRSDDNFEAANVYFHIDNSMRWINDSLSIPLTPYQYVGGVRFDPHGLSGDDNSHYISSTGSLAFGDGGVDDAEDLGVVLHELGHGLHDWLTVGGISQVEGLSEGCGDYWCSSYIRSTGYWTTSDPPYNWVFIWDGHNPFWNGRITNYTAHYPEGLVGQIHTDGQMWASSLMSIYDLIGRIPTDSDFLEGLAMTNGSSNQPDAANAFIQADQILYGGTHLNDIIQVFTDRGYIEGPITAEFKTDVTGGQAPLTVNFTDLSISTPDSIISWEWDFDNDGNIDSYDQNPTWIYNLAGSYTVTLTVSDGTNSDIETKPDYISVNAGVLVWEGVANGPNYSGVFIRDHLQNVGFMVVYSTAADLPSNMAGFDAIFLSFGNYGTSGTTNTTLTDENAASIVSYLQNGGKVYLEGGDALGFDQSSNTILQNLLGIAVVSDGSGSNTFVTDTQPENNWIDIFTPSSDGLVAFNESTVGDVAIQGTGSNSQKSFCFSYALAFLNDAAFPSTKANFLNQIITFFDVIVPVELTSFNAEIIDNKVVLNWTTATETNNLGFEIERKIIHATDGEWITIGFKEGKGNSIETHNYQYIDKVNDLNATSLYYRLKQVDYDGSYEYSDVVLVNNLAPVDYALYQNFPNPYNPVTTITYSLPIKAQVELVIYNALGESITRLINEEKKAGKYSVKFDATNLPSGIYFYKLQAGYPSTGLPAGRQGSGQSFVETKKMILLK
jgi:PKD repeat protein